MTIRGGNHFWWTPSWETGSNERNPAIGMNPSPLRKAGAAGMGARGVVIISEGRWKG